MPSPYRTRVALVGAPARVAPVRKALLSLPDVDLTMSPRFALAQASSSDVVILDGQAPPPQLPAVPEMILIDPPSLPGGRALGDAADTAVSGVDAANPLLSGVDITSLDVPAGTAERLSPPSWMQPVIWTASGPLLASGEDAGQRVAVLAFDPARTNLPQLSAFPLLLRNLLRWGWDDVPESAPLGSDVLVSPAAGATQVEIAGPYLRRDAAPTQPTALTITPARPGIYTVIERGPWGIRIERMAVNATAGPSPSPGERLELGLPGAVPADAGASTPAGPRPWWPWIGLAALIALAAEWSFVMAQGRG
ncbi:MAG: hypothetical protein JOZ41_07280 [Chloroflexi bacterium]|nr:hypothetical protein [Chloroflexota bacterium]